MIVKKEDMERPIEIDLTGPEGNAFSLLGQAQKWAKQLGIDYDELYKDMTSDDYEHLVEVFDKKFGHFCTLIR